MWLMTRQGFFSVVRSQDTPGRLMIRARASVDLERLAAGYLSDRHILSTPERDYPYRLLATRNELRVILAGLASGVDYPNFKDEVARAGDAAARLRGRVYGSVWEELTELEHIDELTIDRSTGKESVL